jgi:hypothetical protein
MEHPIGIIDLPSIPSTSEDSVRPQGTASFWDSFLEEYRRDRERMFSFCREIISNQKEIMGRVQAMERGAATQKFCCPVEFPVGDHETLHSVDCMLGVDRGFREYTVS